MARRPKRWLLAAICVWIVAILAALPVVYRYWPERSDRKTGVVLLLSPETQTIGPTEVPVFTATLVNRGVKDVVLVEVGDGSPFGLRTPSVIWSRQPHFEQPVCGNFNALKATDVFTLAPGESHILSGWIGLPVLRGSGRHRVALRYLNDPQKKWPGVSLGELDPTIWAAVRNSTPLSVVSNTVDVIVVK